MYAFFLLNYCVFAENISLKTNSLKKYLLIIVKIISLISQVFFYGRRTRYFGVIFNITIVIPR